MDKIKRTAWDLAAAEFFDSTIESKGLANKAIERVSDGRMCYNRVRDIRMGLHGPIRLSELITLCTILHISPTETLKKIIARIAAHPEDYDVAANKDPNKTLEAETPRD